MPQFAHARASTSALEYLDDLQRVLPLVPTKALGEAIELLLEARTAGRRVYIIGNGGSAATASHFVCDFIKTAHVAGFAPLRVFALADSTPLMTAWANDRSYERSFAEQIAALVERKDVVIAISASGNSPNVVAALKAATAVGAYTIGLLGFDGGAAIELVDIAIHIPCHHYGLVEDAHAAIGHAMTAAIRDVLTHEPADLHGAALAGVSD
jgi:D-sedoheptulose 7-phosphate isomerase